MWGVAVFFFYFSFWNGEKRGVPTSRYTATNIMVVQKPKAVGLCTVCSHMYLKALRRCCMLDIEQELKATNQSFLEMRIASLEMRNASCAQSY